MCSYNKFKTSDSEIHHCGNKSAAEIMHNVIVALPLVVACLLKQLSSRCSKNKK